MCLLFFDFAVQNYYYFLNYANFSRIFLYICDFCCIFVPENEESIYVYYRTM